MSKLSNLPAINHYGRPANRETNADFHKRLEEDVSLKLDEGDIHPGCVVLQKIIRNEESLD